MARLYRTFGLFAARFFSAFIVLAVFATAARADDPNLPPQTRLRLTVVQWVPIKGQFETWTALGGEFVVSEAGKLSLPIIGSVDVGTMDVSALADDIATRLQSKMGLVDKPNASVAVLQMPPVYLVGDISKPGEYAFRDGLTVLKAVAMGGGVLRSAAILPGGQTTLLADLQKTQNDKLQAEVKLARLRSEQKSATEVDIPPTLSADPDAGPIIEREKLIFAARAKGIERQTKSFEELRVLLDTEIGVLQQKITDSDKGIKSLEDQLDRVKELVEKGMAITSRQSDLERSISQYRSERLDNITAVMRARQAISEATRNADGLTDQNRVQIVTELQDTEARFKELTLKSNTGQRLLLDALVDTSTAAKAGAPPPVSYALIRRNGKDLTEIAADENSVLMPGDVVKVSRRGGAAPPPAAPLDAAQSNAADPTIANNEGAAGAGQNTQ